MNEAVKVSELIAGLMDEIVDQKPEDRSPLGRNFAVLMTMLEQAYSYAKAFCDKE